ncbi:MAG TPA: hypothetical protein VNT20_11045 [Flavisolibacter sp.]|jgi:hypothetical protein|nr:hypothetical protein [Flavisolibacter sp.]
MNSDRKNNRTDPNTRDMNANRLERDSSTPNDLPDSKQDQEKLQPEETFIDLPDVKDIPGQEFVNTPPVGSLGDTTISSDDEEGVNVFEKSEDEDLRHTGNDADVSRNERKALEQIDYMPTTDEDNLQNARMDNVDFQNEPLNEKSFGEERTGRDLDVPGNTDETRTSSMGQGDEENKYYSLGSADNDNVTEGTP